MMNIIASEFPKASELNPFLYMNVCKNIIDKDEYEKGKNDLGGRRTGWNLHEQKIEEIDVLISWIKRILPGVSKKFAAKTGKTAQSYNVNSFEIDQCWGVHYNKGESLREHNHFPHILSFVYYVKTPTGTAPIIIENHTYVAKEGQCIFFLASQYHSVGLNDCDERCAIVGNILYRF